MQAFSTSRGQTVLGPRSQHIRIHLPPHPTPGSTPLPVLSLVSFTGTSSACQLPPSSPSQRGLKVPLNQGSRFVISTAISQPQLMNLLSPHAYSGKGLAEGRLGIPWALHPKGIPAL